MENGTFKITLADGTSAENLTMNGNNFVSKTEVKEEFFAGKLDTVTVESEEGVQELHDVKLIQISKVGAEWWFILAEKTENEKLKEKLEAAEALNAADITNVQLAVAEVFEMLMNGGLTNG